MSLSADLNIEIEIKFDKTIGCRDFTKILKIIDTAIFKNERDELDKLLSDLGATVPNLVRDASHMRLDNHIGNFLQISQAKKGSIILGAVATGAAYWILQNTIGESLKEAYLDSPMHSKLKALLKSSIHRRTSGLADQIHKQFRNRDNQIKPLRVEIENKNETDYVDIGVLIEMTKKQTILKEDQKHL